MSAQIPLLLPQHEAAKALGVGLDRLRDLITTGQIGIVEIGSDERVPVDELRRWVAANTRASKKCRSGEGGSGQPAGASLDGSSISATPMPPMAGSTRRSRATLPRETPKLWNGDSETSSTARRNQNVHPLPSDKR